MIVLSSNIIRINKSKKLLSSSTLKNIFYTNRNFYINNNSNYNTTSSLYYFLTNTANNKNYNYNNNNSNQSMKLLNSFKKSSITSLIIFYSTCSTILHNNINHNNNNNNNLYTTAFLSPLHLKNNYSTVSSASSLSFCSSNNNNIKNNNMSLKSSSNNIMSNDATTINDDNDANDVDINNNVLDIISNQLDNTWIQQLNTETNDNYIKSINEMNYKHNIHNNKIKRQIYNGHYILVKPTPMNKPKLLLYNKDLSYNIFKLTNKQMNTNNILLWLSGNINIKESWATPYALSIVGTRYTNNCPFGTGNGYGDGRAISIGEYNNYEIQLKGCGTTSFHRGGDGRAVLRSSIREYLASENMYYLNISTTRALSLIVSEIDTVQRPWYTNNIKTIIPNIDDIRLNKYNNIDDKLNIINNIRNNNKIDPNIMQNEKIAITSRVSKSFVRIGHIDLYARRVEKNSMIDSKSNNKNNKYNINTLEFNELKQIIWHSCYRDYNDNAYIPYIEQDNIKDAAIILLKQSAIQIANMISGWIRVGYVQGNFNADNCLVSGTTMDYGPFGYVEEYNPIAAKWTGSGQHFGFLNQPSAGLANYLILVESILPVIVAYNTNTDEEYNDLLEEYTIYSTKIFENIIDETLRIKLGFNKDNNNVDHIWETLEPLMRTSRTDWTIFFRSLTYIVRDYPELLNNNNDDNDNNSYLYNKILSSLEGNHPKEINTIDYPGCFYETLNDKKRIEWINWLEQWKNALIESNIESNNIYELMINNNPKFILREWILVKAYTDANNNNYNELNNLNELIQIPYKEGTIKQIEKYYKRAPDDALISGGTAFMSCSS